MNISLAKQTVRRFFLAGFYGAVSTAATITIFVGVQSWDQFYVAFNYLVLCLIVGFINGIIQALHKYYITGTTVPVNSDMAASLLE